MNYTMRFAIGFVSFFIVILGAVIWSARLGKHVWAPRVFAWRNPLRPAPQIDVNSDSPLLISNPRYYSLMSMVLSFEPRPVGSGVGGVLRFEVTNRSNKVIHSYGCRYYSPVLVGNGSHGSNPEEGLGPGQSRNDSISTHEYAPLTLTIDFVQFADGTTWTSNSPQSTVKPNGLRAGAQAAVSYLLRMMNRGGTEAVMDTLRRIHADVREPNGQGNQSEFGLFGFYCGVANVAVRLAHEYQDGGRIGVETFLRYWQESVRM